MKPFVAILNGRYETNGTTVRSLSSRLFQRDLATCVKGGQQGWRLSAGPASTPKFHSAAIIKSLYDNAVASLPQPVATKGSQSGRFIIGSRDQAGVFSAAARPKEHTDIGTARAEAERLAKTNNHHTYVVLQIVGEVQASGVHWK